MQANKIINSTKLRFGAVGVLNTIIDFTLLNLFIFVFELDTDDLYKMIIANSVSATSTAIFSFYMNRRFVFKKDKKSAPTNRIAYFLIVSLTGLFLIQNTIYGLVLKYDLTISKYLAEEITNNLVTVEFISVTIAKGFGICGSLIWNYLLYKNLVFKENKQKHPHRKRR